MDDSADNDDDNDDDDDLDVSTDNRIGEEGAKALGKSLRKNSSLQVLNLSRE